MTDSEAIDAYTAFLVGARGRSARTVESYRLALARLGEFMQGAPLLEASAQHLETFCGIWLHKRGVVARSRKPYISAVRSFFGWAAKRDLVRRDPAAELKHPKTAKPLPEAASLASAERLMWAPDLNTFVGVRDAAMLSLLIGCGMRVSGLVSLNAGDLRNTEIDGRPRLVVRAVEKGEKERILPVPREAELLLRVYLDHEQLQAYDRTIEPAAGRVDQVLFVNARNTSVPAHEYHGEACRISRKAVWRMLQRYGEQAGVPELERHPHALRHLFGTELAESGIDLIERQSLMGHADPKSTALYDQMSIRRKTRSLDRAGPLAKVKSPVSELLKRL